MVLNLCDVLTRTALRRKEGYYGVFTNLRKEFKEHTDSVLTVRFKLNFLTIDTVPKCSIVFHIFGTEHPGK